MTAQDEPRVASISRQRVSLYAGNHAQSDQAQSWQDRILTPLVRLDKEAAKPGDPEQSSRQGIFQGEVPRPFNYEEAMNFRTQNAHHSSCIAAKIQAMVGLGFAGKKKPPAQPVPAGAAPVVKEAAAQAAKLAGVPAPSMEEPDEDPSPLYKILNPLCDVSFQDVLQDVGEDFVEAGVGYFEIVRDRSGVIRGIHHIPARHTSVFVEDRYNYHYLVQCPGLSMDTQFEIRFARYGDMEKFRARRSIPPEIPVSEVIAIRQASSRSKYYGFPDWLAAVPSVELVQMHRQHSYDFYNNRGVPEFMGFFIGQKLGDKEWSAITEAVKANVGLGNSYKSIVANITAPPETLKIQFERLGLDGGASTEGQFKEVTDSLAMDIVSAHRVPPLLAGIMIPGKLGASNELVNALIAFQTLVIGPFQQTFTEALKNSLGDNSKSGLGISPEDFKFKTILDKFNLNKVATVGAMRQPLAEAQAEGRDLEAGVED